MVSIDEVQEAIEAAADADNAAISSPKIFPPSVSSEKRLAMTLNMIKRFVEAVPEGTTVDEIRDRIDQIELARDFG